MFMGLIHICQKNHPALEWELLFCPLTIVRKWLILWNILDYTRTHRHGASVGGGLVCTIK